MESIDASDVFAALARYLADENVRRQLYDVHRGGSIVLIMGAPLMRFLERIQPSPHGPPTDDQCVVDALVGDLFANELANAQSESQHELGMPYDPKRIRIFYKHDENASIVKTYTLGADGEITN